MSQSTGKTVLLVGASRGLGYALAEEFLGRGWHVVGTVRAGATTRLHELATTVGARLEVETVDITAPDQVTALHARLKARVFDLRFVNAGVKNDDRETIADVFHARVHAGHGHERPEPHARHRAISRPCGARRHDRRDVVGQGSVANNENGGYEVYRASKAALNTLMRSFAARHRDKNRSFLLMAPGWVRTDMGGPGAPLSIAESIPNLVTTIESRQGKTGLEYLDYLGRVVP